MFAGLTYKTLLLRPISLAVVCAFALSDISIAAPALIPSPVSPARLPINDFILKPSEINIPLEHVAVREVHIGTNGKLFIHIQDAHANLSGQKSLASTLDHLLTRYDLDLILVEGSARDSTLDEVRALAPLEDWKIIARRFLFDGIISGEEYLNLTTRHPMKIMGVEYRDLYDDSIRAYAGLVDKRKDILHYLYRVQTSLDKLKHKHYPRELQDYEKQRRISEREGADFKNQFNQLIGLVDSSNVGLDDFREIQKLKKLHEDESRIEFAQANREQKKLLSELSNRGGKDEVKAFIESSKKVKNLQVSQYKLMQQLLEEADQRGMAPEAFPELIEYREYLSRFADLDLHALLGELDLLEDVVYQTVLTTDDAKKIRAIDRFVGLLGDAHKLQMSSDDFKLFRFNEEDFPTEAWLAFMNQKLAEANFFEDIMAYKPYIDEARDSLGRFYALVDERDGAFIENARRIMTERNENAAVLIAGGYHTDHLTELLKREGSSFMVLTPVVTEETDHEKYERILLAHLDSAEYRIDKAGDGAFSAENVAPTKIPRGMRYPDAVTGSASPSRMSAMEKSAASRLSVPTRLRPTLETLRETRPERNSPSATQAAARMAGQAAKQEDEPQNILNELSTMTLEGKLESPEAHRLMLLVKRYVIEGRMRIEPVNNGDVPALGTTLIRMTPDPIPSRENAKNIVPIIMGPSAQDGKGLYYLYHEEPGEVEKSYEAILTNERVADLYFTVIADAMGEEFHPKQLGITAYSVRLPLELEKNPLGVQPAVIDYVRAIELFEQHPRTEDLKNFLYGVQNHGPVETEFNLAELYIAALERLREHPVPEIARSTRNHHASYFISASRHLSLAGEQIPDEYSILELIKRRRANQKWKQLNHRLSNLFDTMSSMEQTLIRLWALAQKVMESKNLSRDELEKRARDTGREHANDLLADIANRIDIVDQSGEEAGILLEHILSNPNPDQPAVNTGDVVIFRPKGRPIDHATPYLIIGLLPNMSEHQPTFLMLGSGGATATQALRILEGGEFYRVQPAGARMAARESMTTVNERTTEPSAEVGERTEAITTPLIAVIFGKWKMTGPNNLFLKVLDENPQFAEQLYQTIDNHPGEVELEDFIRQLRSASEGELLALKQAYSHNVRSRLIPRLTNEIKIKRQNAQSLRNDLEDWIQNSTFELENNALKSLFDANVLKFLERQIFDETERGYIQSALNVRGEGASYTRDDRILKPEWADVLRAILDAHISRKFDKNPKVTNPYDPVETMKQKVLNGLDAFDREEPAISNKGIGRISRDIAGLDVDVRGTGELIAFLEKYENFHDALKASSPAAAARMSADENWTLIRILDGSLPWTALPADRLVDLILESGSPAKGYVNDSQRAQLKSRLEMHRYISQGNNRVALLDENPNPIEAKMQYPYKILGEIRSAYVGQASQNKLQISTGTILKTADLNRLYNKLRDSDDRVIVGAANDFFLRYPEELGRRTFFAYALYGEGSRERRVNLLVQHMIDLGTIRDVLQAIGTQTIGQGQNLNGTEELLVTTDEAIGIVDLSAREKKALGEALANDFNLPNPTSLTRVKNLLDAYESWSPGGARLAGYARPLSDLPMPVLSTGPISGARLIEVSEHVGGMAGAGTVGVIPMALGPKAPEYARVKISPGQAVDVNGFPNTPAAVRHPRFNPNTDFQTRQIHSHSGPALFDPNSKNMEKLLRDFFGIDEIKITKPIVVHLMKRHVPDKAIRAAREQMDVFRSKEINITFETFETREEMLNAERDPGKVYVKHFAAEDMSPDDLDLFTALGEMPNIVVQAVDVEGLSENQSLPLNYMIMHDAIMAAAKQMIMNGQMTVKEAADWAVQKSRNILIKMGIDKAPTVSINQAKRGLSFKNISLEDLRDFVTYFKLRPVLIDSILRAARMAAKLAGASA